MDKILRRLIFFLAVVITCFVLPGNAGAVAVVESKPLEFTNTANLPAGAWHYFQIVVPAANAVWRVTVTNGSGVRPDLYVQRGALPTAGAFLKRSVNVGTDVLTFADAELTPGVYFIGVFSPGKSSRYTLRSELLILRQLPFDVGLTPEGTEGWAITNLITAAQDFHFKIRTVNPSVGAWRTALTVTAGEADLYLQRGGIPVPGATNVFASERRGADGVVLGLRHPSQFAAGEDWYILVRARANARWSLVSGAAYALDLGGLATNESSSTNVLVGPEGWRFFKTTIPPEALAWKLSLQGATNLTDTNVVYLGKTSAPKTNGTSKFSQSSPLLVVPPYFSPGQLYFIGVKGTNGARVHLDSRQQPVVDLNFASTNGWASITNTGFATYRIQVPPNEIIWQVNLIASNGNPNLYVRRNLVPNPENNDAMSEADGKATDSVTLAPPALSDGTYFVTVMAANKGTNRSFFRLQSGPPTITDINFADRRTNDETNRVGWRYFRVLDLHQQTNALGWDLSLSNAPAGTRIALRRAQAPSRWDYRVNGSSRESKSHDVISQGTFLQQPGHPVDVWYIGVYNPSNALGKFTLITTNLTAPLLVADGAKMTRTNAAKSKWEFFRVDVPAGIQGWDLRLTNVTGGSPRLAIRREGLPTNHIVNLTPTTNIPTTLIAPGSATSWPDGKQWAPTNDWTRRSFSSAGRRENGQVVAMGLGRPLEPGTYYVGVFNDGPTASTYTLWSRYLGTNRSILVPELAYAGGTTNGSVGVREAAYYKVTIGTNAPSWKVRLNVTKGDAMLVVSTNLIPNIESAYRMQKTGREHYLLLPDQGNSWLRAGTYYLAVIGEGSNPAGSRIGSGPANFTLTSIGAAPETNLGALTGDLTSTTNLESGSSLIYRFTTTTNVIGFEAALENRTGHPVMVLRSGRSLPYPGGKGDGFAEIGLSNSLALFSATNGVFLDSYGNEGGETNHLAVSPFRIYGAVAGVGETNQTLVVKARTNSSGFLDARYTLRVKPITPAPLTFDQGRTNLANQAAHTWRFVKVTVPANALGWDLRLTNVVSGHPKMVVCRGALPLDLTTTPGFDPGSGTWPLFAQWAAAQDWTERSWSANGAVNQDGRILAMGLGQPLTPGVYYVGIYSTNAASCTLLSRGIGAGFSIPVTELAFNGGSASASLPAREAAYYKVVIGTNVPSWKLRLTQPTNSEAALLVLKDVLPSVLASPYGSAARPFSPGRKMQKIGPEEFLLLPAWDQTNLAPGNYYLAVAAEGSVFTATNRIGSGRSTFTLTNQGTMPVVNLGTLTSNLTVSGSVNGGECVAYQFTLPPGVVNLEARLENRTNHPVMALRAGAALPDPGLDENGLPRDSYGHEGGQFDPFTSAHALNLVTPNSGIYSLIVKARQTNGFYPNAAFQLRLAITHVLPLAFDGGGTNLASVTNQLGGAWRYFQVDVPTNALGWDLRLANVTAGTPRLMVRRDELPDSLWLDEWWPNPGKETSWPSFAQWNAGSDWTRRALSASGASEDGRILTMGLGRPLEPGRYYVGVASSDNTPMSYTLLSRGIGSGFSIPVLDLPFHQGSVTNTGLLPREAAYFRVVVPTNAPSWKVKLTGLSGEAMLTLLRGAIPNLQYLSDARSIDDGRSLQKSGDEHFLLLPDAGQTNLAPGTNFLAVIGEGVNPTNHRVGLGQSSFVLQSIGSLPVTHLGTVSATNLEQTVTHLAGGESLAYQFTVPAGTPAVEVKLENRNGHPVMVASFTNAWPNAGGSFSGLPVENYGNEGGITPQAANPSLLTIIPHPAGGTHRLIVKARSQNGIFSDASYQLSIRRLMPTNLTFSSHFNTNGFSNVISGVLETNQRTFFRVEVPTNTLGWKLELTHAYGLAALRVRHDALPSDSVSTGTTPFASPAAYLVPPFLTNGTWYVEVKGSNATAFTLTSQPIELERPVWNMPANAAPEFFADTGIGTNGMAVPNYQGELLERGYQHYYAVAITNNLGLLRAQLEAISGNPNLYVRPGFAPTLTHSASGGNGALFERALAATNGTEYANWVPLNHLNETNLPPGIWYFAVAAKNSHARYRLRLSAGNVQTVSANLHLAGQFLARGDWGYYRLPMPANPTNLWVYFSEENGNVLLYRRDVVPPGQSTGVDVILGTNLLQQPYHFTTLTGSPGQFHYLGFRALNDARFSLLITNQLLSAPALSALFKRSQSGVAKTLPNAGSASLEFGKMKSALSLPRPLQITSSTRSSGGAFQFTLQGNPSQIYVIEVSSDLQQWTLLDTVTTDTAGTAVVTDDSANESNGRFYRILQK